MNEHYLETGMPPAAAGMPPAKVAKLTPSLTPSSSFEEQIPPEDLVHEWWFPLVRVWQWEASSGRMMVSIKFIPSCGMSPGSNQGIDIHAVGQTCTITADWPKEFSEMSRVRKYYTKEELQDQDTNRMLNAEEDNIRRVVKREGTDQRATAEIALPFPVMETRDPPMKSVSIASTGTRMITIQLACTTVSTFATKTDRQDQEFDD